ncbi:MAG: heavy metal translocating P-type ATPase [Armatimonadota bacterium]
MQPGDYIVLAAGLAAISFVLWFFLGARARTTVAPINTARSDFAISGMHCPSCMLAIEKLLRRTDGIIEATGNFGSARVSVTYDPGRISAERIAGQITKLGYRATEIVDEITTTDAGGELVTQDLRKRFLAGIVLTTPVLVCSMALMAMPPSPLVYVELALTAIVLGYSGQNILGGAWKALRNRTGDMNVLIAVGTITAFAYSVFVTFFHRALKHSGIEPHVYYETTCVIVTLVLLGKLLEARATRKTSDAILKLLNLQPRRARVLRLAGRPDSEPVEVDVSVDEVRVGDLVVVRPGERLPIDGEITEGYSVVDESMVTGESTPVEKVPGDQVIAGTLNKTGTFVFRATRVGSETMLAQIVSLIRKTQASKAPIQRLADVIAGYFVPAVLCVGIITFVGWYVLGPEPAIKLAMLCFVSVVIIACPCALGLATPTAVTVSTGRAAALGILVRSAEALEIAGRLTAVVLDKTGTITTGKLSLTDVVPADGYDQEYVLTLAATIERRSEHPIGEAIVRAASERSLALLEPENFEAIPGAGICATVAGRRALVGTEAFLESQGMDAKGLKPHAESLRRQGKTVFYVNENSTAIGIIAVADTIKPTSRKAIEQLKKLGLKVILITGDNATTARAVAHETGIDTVMAEVQPNEKALMVAKLQEQGEIVAMVGDGINDAPALVQANLGIAMGAGTDIAMESADITLVGNDLLAVPQVIEISRATLRIIKQNLVLAFAYNVLAIPIAAGILYPAFGLLLNPMIASAAMSASSISVVTNALRLRGVEIQTN